MELQFCQESPVGLNFIRYGDKISAAKKYDVKREMYAQYVAFDIPAMSIVIWDDV